MPARLALRSKDIDQVTRFLSGQTFTAKDLWRIVKPRLRRVPSEAAVLILDDTVQEKPYTNESELIDRHYDRVTGRRVKGIMTACGE